MLDGVACPLKDQVRSLGVLLDEQIAAVSRSTFHQPRPVYYLHTFLDKKDLTTVSPALVTSRLNFCNVLYVGLPLDMAQKLQLVQNAAECIWTGANRFQHITPVLRKLHWQWHIKHYLVWDHGTWTDGLLPYWSSWALCSADGVLLCSATQWGCHEGRTFSVVTPILWNSLPRDPAYLHLWWPLVACNDRYTARYSFKY